MSKSKKPKLVKPLKVLKGTKNRKLRKVSEEIKHPTARKYKILAKRLIATMAQVGSLSIAAPQVGVLRRMIVISSEPSSAYPTAPRMGPLVMLNIKVVRRSPALKKDWEGCASIPGIYAKVLRYSWIEVEYTNLRGQVRQVAFDGLLARLLQHESDHLDGTLFLDGADIHTIVQKKDYLVMVDAARARKRKK